MWKTRCWCLASVFEADRTGKAKPGKRAQRVIAQCKKLGWAEELVKPGPSELRRMMAGRAAPRGRTVGPRRRGPAGALRRDPYLLENEVDKLAAAAGYGVITPALVAEMGWSAWRPTSLRWCG